MVSRLLTPVLTLFLCSLLFLGHGFSTLSNTVLDSLFLLRGSNETSQAIVIIGIDEQSLEALGAWPFPRKLHGTLLKQLSQAKAIGFDFLFSEPTGDDESFNTAIELAPPVVFTAARDYSHNTRIPAPTLYNYYGFGHIDSILGNNGLIRKTRLQQRSGLKAFSLILLQAAKSPVQVVNPSTPKLINFYGPEFTFLFLSYVDVLRGNLPSEFFKDRLVLIGTQALGIGDVHVTPFTSDHPMPGVEIQATILNNLLDNNFLTEHKHFSWALTTLYFLLSIILWPALNERQNIILNLGGILIPIGASLWLFQYNCFFDPSAPLLILVTGYLVHLSLQGLWMTRKLIIEVNKLDHELETGLDEIYTNIPQQLIPPSPTVQKQDFSFLTSGLRRYIDKMHDGAKALALQNHFINHLLKEEVDPLILWEITDGQVILANSMFNSFWHNKFDHTPLLPDLHQFVGFLNQHILSENTPPPLTSEILKHSNRHEDIDISLRWAGKTQYYKINIHPVHAEHSRFSGILASITDVTKIRELEHIKSQLLGIVSHELKLPLTTIFGYSEMLVDYLEGEPKHFASEILAQTKRLNRLIENLLDLERIESGQYTIRRFPLDLTIVFQDAINGVTPLAKQKDITIQVDIPTRITPLSGDEPLLLQTILNLLDNSIKFSPNQSTIQVRLTEKEDSFEIQISDQGQGIAKKDTETIFDKFDRGSNDVKKTGFGLGLNLVKQVIEGHSGTISVDSTLGEGATFSILLPK